MRLTSEKDNQAAMGQPEDEEIVQVVLKPSIQKEQQNARAQTHSEVRRSVAERIKHRAASNRKYLVEGRGFIALLIALTIVLFQFVIGWFGMGIPHLQEVARELHSSQAAIRQLQRNQPFQYGNAEEIVTERNLRSAYGVGVKVTDIPVAGRRVRACVPLIDEEQPEEASVPMEAVK